MERNGTKTGKFEGVLSVGPAGIYDVTREHYFVLVGHLKYIGPLLVCPIGCTRGH